MRHARVIYPGRLKQARLYKGFTMMELAKRIGVSHQAISQYEHGQAIPSWAVVNSMIRETGLSLTFFTTPMPKESNQYLPIFFRSLLSADRSIQYKTRTRIEWLEEILAFTQKYVDIPEVNLPIIDEHFSNDVIGDETIEELASVLRRHWGLGIGPISNVLLLLEKNGFVITRGAIGDQKTDACSKWSGDRPFIFLGDDKGSAVRSRFDAMHEAAHILMHRGLEEQINDKDIFKRMEKEAHQFAGAFLLPRDSFGQEVMSPSIEHFISLKSRWKVSIAAMLYRCETLGLFSKNQVLYMRKQISARKMRTIEPLDNELGAEMPSLLKQAVTALVDNRIITCESLIEHMPLTIDEIEDLCNLERGFLGGGEVIDFTLKHFKEQ